jgi:hypothetical protein
MMASPEAGAQGFNNEGGVMFLLKKLVMLGLAGFFLVACNGVGSDPGPKKPGWASQSSASVLK